MNTTSNRMKAVIISLLLTVSLHNTLCRANPLQPTGEGSTEPFAGSVTGCRVPNSSYCGISHYVPESLATLVHLIEGEIRGSLSSGEELDACQTLQKEIQCAQRFPRCVDDSVVFTSTEDCESKVRGSCDESVAQELLQNSRLCGLENKSIPMGACSSISQFKQGNNFSHCEALGNEVRVTEWMYHLISYTDSMLEQSLDPSGSLHQRSATCSPGYARYSCQLLGECTEDGSKISLKGDYHSCEQTLSCYDNEVQNYLRPLFNCDLWLSLDYPSLDLRTATPPISPTTQVVTETTASTRTVIRPSDLSLPEVILNNADSVHSSHFVRHISTVGLVVLICVSVLYA